MAWTIHNADVLEVLKSIQDSSVDAVLCDPPYGISFMQDWDSPWKSDAFRRAKNEADAGRESVFGRMSRRGPEYDAGVSFQLWVGMWAKELLRVLRPGGYIFAFGGSRTYHRLAVGIEDAGFEIRDAFLYWGYFSGMPKSLQTDKAIDKHFGAERPVIGTRTLTGNAAVSTKDKGGTYSVGQDATGVPPKEVPITAPATEEAKRWEGYGSAAKPSYEPVVVARKPLDGTVANNAIKHGIGGLAIDACRIGSSGGTAKASYPNEKSENCYGDGLNGNCDVDRDIGKGRWPSNLLLGHSSECRLVGTKTVKAAGGDISGNEPTSREGRKAQNCYGKFDGRGPWEAHGNGDGTETVEEWACVDACPIAEIGRQCGDHPGMSGGGKHRTDYPGGMFGAIDSMGTARSDSGSPARFFFQAKVSRAEREFGCENLPLKTAGEATGGRKEGSAGLDSPRAGASRTGGAHNAHPTLKPISLTTYLARLLLPPPRADGEPRRILVPFSGAGSEMIGCLRAGWDDVTGIEQSAEYIEIAKARLERWSQVPADMDPDDAVKESRFAERESAKFGDRQIDLFAKGGSSG